jgi:hypothetical protein
VYCQYCNQLAVRRCALCRRGACARHLRRRWFGVPFCVQCYRDVVPGCLAVAVAAALLAAGVYLWRHFS